MLPLASALKNHDRSYWWLTAWLIGVPAGSLTPTSSTRGRRVVVRIRRRGVVLERLVVLDVVGLHRARDVRVLGVADRPAALERRRLEAALEPSPRHPVGVHQIADVAPGQRRGDAAGSPVAVQRRARVRALIEQRLGIADQRAVGDVAAGSAVRHRAVGVAADQVDRARRRGPELRVVRVVVEREVLRQVPQRGDGVAVVVVHDDPVRAVIRRVGERRTGCSRRRSCPGRTGPSARMSNADCSDE